MPELKLLFLQTVVILVAVRLMAAAFRLAGQPGVVGEMAAGILLGPSLSASGKRCAQIALRAVSGGIHGNHRVPGAGAHSRFVWRSAACFPPASRRASAVSARS
jgi:Kef-type K+ transport system membrane component KefB